ncbi:MAG: isochorismatase family protein [Ilumatobacteraceae bacterium]
MPTFVDATVPYPWPYDGELDVRSLAVVVCGAQGRFVEACVGADVVLAAIVGLADTVRDGGGRVVWVRHGRRDVSHPAGAGFLPVRGDQGWDLVTTAAVGDAIVDSAGWDGSFASDLDHTLRAAGVRALALGGFASELTVDSTVRTLNDRGHECLVLTDGCAPLDAELGARAHHSLTMSGGIFGALGTIDHLVGALDGAPVDHDHRHAEILARSTP